MTSTTFCPSFFLVLLLIVNVVVVLRVEALIVFRDKSYNHFLLPELVFCQPWHNIEYSRA